MNSTSILPFELCIYNKYFGIKELLSLSKVSIDLNKLASKFINQYKDIIRRLSNAKILINNSSIYNRTHTFDPNVIYDRNYWYSIFGRKLTPDELSLYYMYFIYKCEQGSNTNYIFINRKSTQRELTIPAEKRITPIYDDNNAMMTSFGRWEVESNRDLKYVKQHDIMRLNKRWNCHVYDDGFIMYFASSVDGSDSVNLDSIYEINSPYSLLRFRYQASLVIDTLPDKAENVNKSENNSDGENDSEAESENEAITRMYSSYSSQLQTQSYLPFNILKDDELYDKFSYDNIEYDIVYYDESKTPYYSVYMFQGNTNEFNIKNLPCDASQNDEGCCIYKGSISSFRKIYKYSPLCGNRLLSSKIEINNKLLMKYYKMMYGKKMSIDDILNT